MRGFFRIPQATAQPAPSTGVYGFTALADSEWARRIELASEPDPDGSTGPRLWLLLRELGYGGMKPEAGDLPQTLAALGALGPALERYLLAERHGDAMAARGRLLERLARIA